MTQGGDDAAVSGDRRRRRRGGERVSGDDYHRRAAAVARLSSASGEGERATGGGRAAGLRRQRGVLPWRRANVTIIRNGIGRLIIVTSQYGIGSPLEHVSRLNSPNI